MSFEFKIKRQVEFCDTDMAGIMHFSNFFRFMEVAEHGFYRTLGIEVHPEFLAGKVGWPRVHAACDYKHPLRFEEQVEVHLLVRTIHSKTVEYTFIFRKEMDGRPIEVARGSMIAVAVVLDPARNAMKAVPIPPEIRAKINVAPPELFKEEKFAYDTH
jgi:acyl-CoA thioester hydrolase